MTPNGHRFVLIGGGEIGRPGQPVQTLPIDKELCSLTGKVKPRLLFIPTASSDSPTYIRAVEMHFGHTLGCEVNSLTLLDEAPPVDRMREMVFAADLVYVGGGNTRRMLAAWLRAGLDLVLAEASSCGIVLSGISAGAICWCENGVSDSVGAPGGDRGFGLLGGMGLLPLTLLPHYRPDSPLDAMLASVLALSERRTLCLTDCAALEVAGGQCRVLLSEPGARAFLARVNDAAVELECVLVGEWLFIDNLQ